MKRYLTSIIVIAALVFVPACWFGRSQSLQDKKFVLLDVNDKSVYEDCHIKNAIHVDLTQLTDFAKKLNKQAEVVVYCSNYLCTASELAVQELQKLGFENVAAYEGGTAEWFNLGYPVEGPCKSVPSQAAKPEHMPSIRTIEASALKQKIDEQLGGCSQCSH